MRSHLLALYVMIVAAAVGRAQFPTEYSFGDELTGTDFTIAAWFNTLDNQQTTDVALIANKNWGSGSNPGFILTVDADGDANEWKVNANAAGGSRIDTDWQPVALDTWYFVAATFDRDGNVTAYHQGQPVANPDPSPTGSIDTFEAPNFYDFNIGQDGTGNYGGGQGFQGLVDDVAIWNRSLDASEIDYIYNQAINSNNALGAILSDQVLSGTELGAGIQGYYAFENDLTVSAGTGPTGIARTSPELPGAVSYDTSLTGLGSALSLDGSNYVTIGDSFNSDVTEFNGNSPTDNLASNADNWSVGPAGWVDATEATIAAGTTNSFSGANTGPAVFDSSFGSQTLGVARFGSAGETTYIETSGTATLTGVGGSNSIIGVNDSNIVMTMSGSSVFEHNGGAEEGSQLDVAASGSTVSLVINGSSELTAGPRVADSTYANGFRRPIEGTDAGLSRFGDDMDVGNGGTLTMEMNDDSVLFVPDVLYPNDSSGGSTEVVQNGNSLVIANWDTRFLDTGGHTATTTINWTLNDDSRFVVARDHGLGETSGSGSVTINVNDNAEFFAGDRIVMGAGTDAARVTINANGGLVKVGGDSPDASNFNVDATGAPSDGQAVDWILHMGGGAQATLNVQGGDVEIGRQAYVGRGGGTAVVNVASGAFRVLGVGVGSQANPVAGLGNGPGGGVPTGVVWQSAGGDLILGYDDGDSGTLNYSGGVVETARDVIVGFDNSNDASGGAGQLRVDAVSGSTAGNSFTVGGDLSFAGDFSGARDADARLTVGYNSGDLSATINVAGTNDVANGDVFIYDGNSGDKSYFTMDVAQGAARTPGAVNGTTYTVISYAGTRTGTFDESIDHGGVDYTLTYDDANKNIDVSPTFVYAYGDADKASTSTPVVDDNDFAAIDSANKFGQGNTAATWSEGDFDNDDDVDGSDLILAAPFRGIGNYLTNGTGPTVAAGTLTYDPSSGSIALESTTGGFDSFVLSSESGIFTGDAATLPGGPYEVDSDAEVSSVFATTTTSPGSSLNLGNIAVTGLDLSFLMEDLGALGGLTGNDNFEFSIIVAGAVTLGDFNGDGVVDAADYPVWRDNLGSTDESLINDAGLSDGVIDGEDYAVWRSNFGATSAGGSLAGGDANVPEPQSLILILGGVAAAALVHRRRRT